MRIVTLFILAYCFIMSGCMNGSLEDNGFDSVSGGLVMFYQETQCSDPWDELPEINATVNGTDQVNQLLDYLTLYDIELISVSYEFDENIIACLECHCRTGGTFYVNVPQSDDVIKKLTEIGFQIY